MAIAIFYISLLTLIIMFTIKYFGIFFHHHEFISNIVCENDKHCHRIVHHSKKVVSKIKFKNFHRLTVIAIGFIKKETVYLKRRFDSKQPTFFLSPQKPNGTNKHPVSFFLKKVSEYKGSLKDKGL